MELLKELQNPVLSIPSKNYHFESNMMFRLPAYPIKKFCAKLDNLPPKSRNHKDLLSARNVQVFEALNSMLDMFTNYTGDKNCSS